MGKTIKIKSLHLENFKGVRKFDISFTDGTNTITGANATGKTTLIDSFRWLLFGQDSTGKTDFQIRPVDEYGKMVDNVEISVAAVLLMDDERIELVKKQKQKWVKRRGSEIQTFQGNENSYTVNGFPFSQKDFDAKVASIVDERLFRLLTDPRTFPNMKWQEQREILLLFVSDITDEDILNAYGEKYSLIAEDVKAAGAEKAKEKAGMILRKLKEDQKTYSVRIDEAARQMVEVDVEKLIVDKEAAESHLSEIRNAKSDLDTALSEVNSIQDEIVSTRVKMADLERAEQEKVLDARYNAQKAYNDILSEIRLLTDQYNRTANALDLSVHSVEMWNDDINKARTEYFDILHRTLPDADKVCPVCGRPFEDDKIADIRTSFEANKKKELSLVDEKGRRLRDNIEATSLRIENMRAELLNLTVKISDKKQQAQDLHDKADALPVNADMSTSEAYQEAQKRLADLQARLSTMDNGESRKQALDAAERDAVRAIRDIDSQLAVADANKRAEKRVEELRAEQLDCSQRVADQEQILCLLEEFVRAKMDMLSDKINSKFSKVRFRLFTEQINGGMKETCVMQIATNGSYVDYASANNAGRIIGGLDVIHALSGLYGVSAPIWLDNSECLDHSNTPEVDTQLILLKVSDDKELTIQN